MGIPAWVLDHKHLSHQVAKGLKNKGCAIAVSTMRLWSNR